MKQKKSWLSLLLAIMLIFNMTSFAFATEDHNSEVKNHKRNSITFDFDDSDEAPWAGEYIGKMQSKNVLKGYEDGTFRPNASVSRIEAIVMAVRLMGLEEEALAKPADVPLHFKDEKNIPQWARGHVAVALENGLFNPTEESIQPNKSASRIWIVQLLVKSLGLEQEALSQMTTIPDFKDVSEIPAGSIGYVNVAIEQGITTGYEDNTFRPNKPVTRGEMAAFLDRTNDGLLDNDGAVTVQGTITAIEFDQETSLENNQSVTDSVYQSYNGNITIETFTGDIQTYSISSDLLVQDHDQFIKADQLLVNDIVTLVVKDGIVVEANLIDKEEVNVDSNLIELKIEMKGLNKQEFKIKYKNKRGKVSGEYENELGEEKLKFRGDKAVSQIEELIAQLALTPEMTEEEIIEKVLTALEVEENQFTKLEIKIVFSNGEKVEIELENEVLVDEGYNGILKFKLKAELFDKEKLRFEYEYRKGRVKAEVDKETKEGKERYRNEEAVQTIESLLDEIALTEDMTEDEILEAILTGLGLNQEDIKELEIEVKFENDNEIEIELKNRDRNDNEDEENDEDDDDKRDEDEQKHKR